MAGNLTFGTHLKCIFCKGAGKKFYTRSGESKPCAYCKGRGLLSRTEERYYLGVIANIRIRTTFADGSPLSTMLDWAHEQDVRARAIEQHHEAIKLLKEGESLTWLFAGLEFKTTLVERRDPPGDLTDG